MATKNENVRKGEISQLVPDYMLQYGASVIGERAFPALEDGLKPVHRRIIYTMYKDKLGSKARHMKLARVAGNTLALHPHGDAAVSESTYTLSQEWTRNLPLVDVQGNNGDIFGNSAAAPRYAEVRMTHAAELMMQGYNENAAETRPNYDASEEEPVYLPSAIPNALTNPNNGIGYGMATNIIPHNPIELLNGAIAVVKSPNITTKKLMTIVQGPDFPTGGAILRNPEFTKGKQTDPIKDETETGQAVYLVRGHISVEQEKKSKRARKSTTLLVIDEIPFGTNASKILKQLADLIEERSNLLGAESVSNESLDGKLRLVVRMNNADKVDVAKQLIYQYTDMETKISCNNNMLVGGRIKQVGIKYYLKKWVAYRKQVLRRVLEFRKNKIERQLNLTNGFLRLIDIADKVVGEAKASNGKEDFAKRLVKKFDFNKEQADAIAGMPMYRLGKQDQAKLAKDKKEAEAQLAEIKEQLEDEKAFNKFVIKDMRNTIKELQKDETINVDRKTRIVDEFKTVDINIQKLNQAEIKSQPAKVIIREDGVLQRMTPRVFENNIDEARKTKPIIADLDGNTRDWVMAFTNAGTVITRLVDEVENINPKYDSEALYKEVPTFKSNQKLIGGTLYNDDIKKQGICVLSLTKLGQLKISKLESSFPDTSTRRYFKRSVAYNGLKKAKDGDEVILATTITPEDIKNKKLVITVKGKKHEHALADMNIQGASGSGAKKFPEIKNMSDFEKWELV